MMSIARLGATFVTGIQRQAGPEAVAEDHLDRVLLRVVDHDALRLDARVGDERVDDDLRALPLVLEMRGVDVDELLVVHREIDVVLEPGELVARHAVQADLADAEHGRPLEVGGDELQDLARQRPILGLLGVQAHPREVGDAVLRRALRLEVDEPLEVVDERLRARTVVAGPERGLRDGDAAAHRHRAVVVGGARDHVRVQVDVLHVTPPSRARRTRSCGPATRAASCRGR